ncbi:MAG: biopolymer transporter ExbB [Cycloclasticus sp.]|nr:biopolymer transporter ExbB [Cycloclasticus sp.]MBG97116.1 biopolymer transporter ExbB [Cycloclasticus sp.]HAI96413.1 biopolymer transporter ExbB [Methylococcaceae bacterium]
MVPIIVCSIISLAIIGERFWSLSSKKILPSDLVSSVWKLHKANQLDKSKIQSLSLSSPLGRVLAAGIVNQSHGREIMRESIEEVGRQVAHELEKFLNSLGTIASITPLLGLLGTVIGMIKVFAAITAHGVGDPAVLAEGISQALITTASGMSVAIPSLMFYRYFRGKVDELVINMESEALKLVEMMHGERE